MFGLARRGAAPRPSATIRPRPTLELRGDEAIAFGRHEVRAIHTPGHTPARSACISRNPGETPLLFAGDTLFRGSIGRTDLWGGSMPAIKNPSRSAC
jgi:glyoxylase-like metal-dependent hydrolase (beta-lactamase superfamily II)